jgi:hypothetical protein
MRREKLLRGLQIGSVEAFAELLVDMRQQLTRFAGVAVSKVKAM